MGSPRPQSPRPSTSRDHTDRRDDRRRSRDYSPDRKDDRRKSRIPKRNSSPSSLVINKRIPKETQGENSTPEKNEKKEEKGEKEKPRSRKHLSSSKDSTPKEDKKINIRKKLEETRQTLKKIEEKREKLPC